MFFLWLLINIISFNYYNQPTKTCINNNCFYVDFATNTDTRNKWLMYVRNMPENQWMLFIFEKTWIYSFWMKNTLINLDIIWIDENYKVVYIEYNATPCKTLDCITYNPNINSKYVLEINWNLCKKYWIKIWDHVYFK